MVQDEVIYRCINGACARALPRRVEYCPYCGTSQSTGLPRPDNVATPPPVSIAKPTPIPVSMQMPPAAPPAPAPAVPPPRVARAAAPPQREPVKLRYWLLALAALWMIWMTQRPSPKKIDARIDNAIALARACKAVEAQAELIALKGSSATPAQMQRLQAALNDAGGACDNMRPRGRPASKPGRQLSGQQSQSARNLIADARLAMAAGDYRAASDKMEVCAAMIEGGNRECSALKAKADRLQGELQRCLADGREWSADRCQ
ncbi:MAG TPA: hypothetical protein VFS02_24030 [Telluria sp.]|nr:hypothetical protein [Telluria sp.]